MEIKPAAAMTTSAGRPEWNQSAAATFEATAASEAMALEELAVIMVLEKAKPVLALWPAK